jgi:hypothetical protein
MPESALDSPARQAHATTVLARAEEILAELEADNSPKRNLALLQASFLARLAAALLLEPGFPDLPAGFERLLDRDRARLVARQLSESRGRLYQYFSKKVAEPAPNDRNPGAPLTDTERRLGAETAETLRQLEMVRRELLNEYLHLHGDSNTSMNPEVQAASLALLDRYWKSSQRLPEMVSERPSKPSPRRSRRAIADHLHPPLWKHEVTWELWQTLDQRYLFWSDPPSSPDPTPLSQEP